LRAGKFGLAILFAGYLIKPLNLILHNNNGTPLIQKLSIFIPPMQSALQAVRYKEWQRFVEGPCALAPCGNACDFFWPWNVASISTTVEEIADSATRGQNNERTIGNHR
jgi:hypothetical protein